MRMLILTFGLLLSNLISYSQQAPDFTVTDTDGQVHHLYADYLNQGKTVMIKIFFTTCPPCNSIAPLMEPFYQEWGAGQNDVEFFEMTDKSFDTDILVEAYSANYNETFPAISMQGNSLATVQPYKSGTFGQWLGTPCFIVIAPNGTVQFNVGGNGNQATIDAVDAAIAATGAVKPGQQIPIAPDFLVTDTDGQTHHLYADYLNQGKTVMLEIFNTTSSGSNAIAPLLQPLYEEWGGGGDSDVEFICMTDKNADTDPVVFAYQEDHDLTLKAISTDGGSLAAVVPYKDGTFGPWVGTPTFVVISPDKTVQYNVHGADDAATIEAIDEAITATGATKPVPPTLAPDFTVTDVDGQVHHLYADYLNQGKTVLLEVFYTTCPPCNAMAPYMEPFYQEWGAGDYDVEFFELSDKNFDTDALVTAYKELHGETFIAAGKDGGSLAAVQPYKNGSFGPWSGTPTFVVIAPDGTVQYDIDGPNEQANLAALDAALLATGAEKPSQGETPVSIGGTVQFLFGSLGVNNVIVQVVDSTGAIMVADTTDASGNFNFQVYESLVQSDWKIKAIKNGNPINGVNALDLVQIQKHIILKDTIDNPLLRIAADANTSVSINTLDMITMLKIILGITTNFPNQQSWILVPADSDFSIPTHQPPVISSYTIPLQEVLNGSRSPDFIGIKKGDANGNANPNQ